MASSDRGALGRSIQLLRQRSKLGTDVRAHLPLLSILRSYLPQSAPLAGQPHARERHRTQAMLQCLPEMRSTRSPARTRQLAHTSRSGDLRPEAFAPAEARRILSRLEFHYTPKHASWLNMVEIEIGVLR